MFLCVLFVRKRRPPDLRPVFSIELPTARLRQSQGSRWSAVPTSNGEQVWPLSNAKKAKLKSWAKLRTSWNPLAITGLLLEITLLWVRLLVPTLEPGGIFKAMVNRQINPRYSEISMAPYRCVFKSVHAKVKEDSIYSSGASYQTFHVIMYIYIHMCIYIYVYIWAISKTLGSRKGHPQIWEGPIAYHTFVQ